MNAHDAMSGASRYRIHVQISCPLMLKQGLAEENGRGTAKC